MRPQLAHISQPVKYLGNHTSVLSPGISVSFGPIALVCAWLLGFVLTRMLTIEIIPAIPSGGLRSDLLKTLPIMFIGTILFVCARRKRSVRLSIEPVLRDPMILYLLASQCASSIMSDTPGKCLMYVIVLASLFLISRLLVTIVSDVEIRAGLAIFSALVATSMSVVALLCSSLDKQSSIMSIVDSEVGGTAMIAGSLAFAWRQKWIAFAWLALAYVTIVFFETRGALFGLTASFLTIWCLPSKRKMFLLWITVIVIAVVVLNVPTFHGYLLDLSEKALRLEDPDRGFGSGLTGRVDAWRDSWLMFLKRPLFGTGPRTQGDYPIRNWVGCHNGYLATLLEVGLFGAIPVFALLVRGIFWVRKKKGSSLACILSTAAVAIAVRAMCENLLFNGISLTSITLILWLEYARPTTEHHLRWSSYWNVI